MLLPVASWYCPTKKDRLDCTICPAGTLQPTAHLDVSIACDECLLGRYIADDREIDTEHVESFEIGTRFFIGTIQVRVAVILDWNRRWLEENWETKWCSWQKCGWIDPRWRRWWWRNRVRMCWMDIVVVVILLTDFFVWFYFFGCSCCDGTIDWNGRKSGKVRVGFEVRSGVSTVVE